jgi:hypothetical protein
MPQQSLVKSVCVASNRFEFWVVEVIFIYKEVIKDEAEQRTIISRNIRIETN